VKILCVFGEHNYGDPARGTGYEYANFLPAFRRLGHEIVFFESFSRVGYRDFAELNRRFLETMERERPDLVFCVLMGYELWLETMALARRGTGAALVNWSTDDSWKYPQFSRFIAPAFHLYATTCSEACERAVQEGHDNFFLTQWAADGAKLAEPLPADKCRYQVSFVGSRYGNRSKWVKNLRDRGIEVTCFGHGWERGPVAAAEIPRIMRESAISLNFGDSGLVLEGFKVRRSRQIKARIFEVPGAGGFLMTESAAHLEDFFSLDREVAVFNGVDDLAAKIRYYLSHPPERDAMARAGHGRIRAGHTYEHRLAPLLDRARAVAVSQQAGNSRRPGIDWPAFERLESGHRRQNVMLRLLRAFLVVPAVLVWGPKRGPRAARRLLFEACWRLAGRQTYSATGLPGRLFHGQS